jgi:YVTN family beta-propeller protein
VRVGLLGPLEVVRDGERVALGGPRQRALLALMLLEANAEVSRERLIDRLWDERPPPSADATFDAYVYRLRKLLGPERLTRDAAGYALHVEPGELDLARFGGLTARADAARATGDPASAAAILREALALWRGPALADVVFQSAHLQEQAARLEERRMLALEQRLESDLASGSGPELVSELEHLLRAHPLRERLAGQLVVALYRCGRQSDALAAVQDVRRRLSHELGLDLSPELRELETKILRHDPALRPGSDRDQPPPSRRVPGRRTRPVRRVAALAAGVAALVAAAVAVAVVSPDSRQRGEAGTSPPTPAIVTDFHGVGLDQRHRTIALSGSPDALAVEGGVVWVSDARGNALSRIDPATGSVTDRVPLDGEPGSLVAGDGAIWAASTIGSTVERVDPSTDTVTQTLPLGGANPVGLAFAGGDLWVADATDQALIAIDPTSGSVRTTISLDLRPSSIATTAGMLWVAGYDADTVEEIDPRSGATVETLRVGDGPASLAFGYGALWVANSLDGTVSRIDPDTASVTATIPVGSGPAAIATGAHRVWVANQYSAGVSAIDPGTNTVSSTLTTGGEPASLAFGAGHIWVGVNPDVSHRGGTLRLITTGRFASIDPAVYSGDGGFLFMRLAYDTLVTFAATSGPDGLRLVPDLALRVPLPSDGGTTYTFRLRRGIRYSDGRVVRASDFRRAIVRLFRLRSPGVGYYSGLVGASGCLRQPQTCTLSQGVVADDATETVAFHLTSPDPTFLFKLTPYGYSAPMPPGIPAHDIGDKAVPGTGPYEIAQVNTRGIRFVRNPYFREWSHAAQPSGNPNAIEYVYSRSHQATIAAIEHGTADWTYDQIPVSELHTLEVRHPAQLQITPTSIVEFLPLNTHVPPFNDVRARQALNYAIDRAKIATWYGGSRVAVPTCQPLTPGLPGYVRYCPYTRDAQKDGIWSAPDLARARRLVDASGTRGEMVDVWGSSDEVAIPPQESRYIASVLRALGYRTRLHVVASETITASERRKFQLSVDGDWEADYPDPSSYLPQFFACGGGDSNGYVCNPRIDAQMRRAELLELQQPTGAAALWARVDRELTQEAAWVPTVDLRAVEFVSARLRNYEYSPVWGFIPDQARLR